MNDPFFQGGRYGHKTTMNMGGLSCTLHMPRARESRFVDGAEVGQSLPECNPRSAFLVDEYPSAPAGWLRSMRGLASYMVPVVTGHGLWLDFNGCAGHSNHVAVVISAQGINAISGLKSDTIRLEQYRNCCPKHSTPFVANRRCSQCGFEWPAQNYLASTVTPPGHLWLDGFRNADGTTRQWVFTEDVRESVAAAVIGAERVHAIGIAFFLARNPKPPPPPPVEPTWRHSVRSAGLGYGGGLKGGGAMFLGRDLEFTGDFAVPVSAAPVTPRKRLEIKAGALIDQKIWPDDQPTDYYQDTPAGVIVINYTDPDTLLEVLQSGRSAASGEGFLGAAGVPVGHGHA